MWLVLAVPAAAQQQSADSLVRLIEAQSGHLQEIDGVSYRKFIGPARFLHNDTYLLCDTALWNVNLNLIHAVGHVEILQENTVLRSDEIEYVVDENLARFRGKVVELFDRDGNILKTKHLDYNTRDSVAVFFNGGALTDAQGKLIESRDGTYNAKERLFSFKNRVQMFTDSVFIRSDHLDYRTDLNMVFFGRGTTAWQGENILYADRGRYDRNREIFYFDKNSYILTPEQEIWSDTLEYFRTTGVAELFDNIQVQDTVQAVICLGDRGQYRPSPMQVVMTLDPALAAYTVEDGVRDTLFVSADTLKYYTLRYGDVDTNQIALARERKRLAEVDPLAPAPEPVPEPENPSGLPGDGAAGEGVPAADSAAVSAAAALAPLRDGPAAALPPDGLPGAPPGTVSGTPAGKEPPGTVPGTLAGKESPGTVPAGSLSGALPEGPADSLSAALPAGPGDSLRVAGAEEILTAARDSLAARRPDAVLPGTGSPEGAGAEASEPLRDPGIPDDTTQIAFIDMFHRVRFYRSDLQGLCDSLAYTGLDSIARFYTDPVMWNDVKNQFTADSMQAVIRNDVLHKVNLISNAFIATQEDSVHFNQVKSTEMSAFFRDNDLYRFDALGGASAIFYLEEDSVITVMNRKESKLLSARIRNRQLQRVKYEEQIKSDAYPVYNLPMDEQRLRGFLWRGDERPKDRYEITRRKVRQSQRASLEAVSIPDYPEAGIYFPQRRDSILAYRAEVDSLRTVRFERREQAREEERNRNRERTGEQVQPASGDPAPETGHGPAGNDPEGVPADTPGGPQRKTALNPGPVPVADERGAANNP